MKSVCENLLFPNDPKFLWMSISVFTCIFYFFKFLIASKNYLVCNKSSRLLVFCGITDLKNFGKVFDGVLPNEKICPSHMTNLQFYLKMSRVTSCLFHGIHPTTVLLHFTNLKFVIYTKLFKKQICFPVVFNLLNLFFFFENASSLFHFILEYIFSFQWNRSL